MIAYVGHGGLVDGGILVKPDASVASGGVVGIGLQPVVIIIA
jgi:hypothetical protein